MPKLYNLEAECHMVLSTGGYRVKLSILDHGIYINGMVVYPPNQKNKDWAVYTPAVSGRYKKPPKVVEFNPKLALWGEVQDACIDAVKLYRTDTETKDDLLDLPKDEFDSKYEDELDKAIKNL